MAIPLIIFAFSIIGFFIHLFSSPKPKTKLRIVELLLVYQLVFSVGLMSFLAFIGLTFMPQMVADILGWPSCPFEQELANVNLGYGVLGILSIWFRGNFWLATIIGLSIWLIGDGIHHIMDMIVNDNDALGKMVPLYSDIIVPIVLIVLYFLYQRWKK